MPPSHRGCISLPLVVSVVSTDHIQAGHHSHMEVPEARDLTELLSTSHCSDTYVKTVQANRCQATILSAPMAQCVRDHASEPKGREFESGAGIWSSNMSK